MIWQIANKVDAQVIRLVDRHYHRRPGSLGKPVGPPGRVFILKAHGAEWITHWPFPQFCDHRWRGMWVCASFRKESPCQELASSCVKQAVAATRWYGLYGRNPQWEPVPPTVWAEEAGVLGSFVTFIDTTKVVRVHKYRKPPKDYGRCYLEAGFVPDGKTEGGLLAFVLPTYSLPAPEEPRPYGYQNTVARKLLHEMRNR